MGVLDRHEVDHLTDPVGRHEAGDQDGGVGEVQLPGDIVVILGADAEVSTVIVVEQRAEHAGRVEPRAAPPVHGAVGGDQRGGLQIPDQPMLGNRRVALHWRSSLSVLGSRVSGHLVDVMDVVLLLVDG
jgi:hypothetical protein